MIKMSMRNVVFVFLGLFVCAVLALNAYFFLGPGIRRLWEKGVFGTTLNGYEELVQYDGWGWQDGFAIDALGLTDENVASIKRTFLNEHKFPLAALNLNSGFQNVSWKQGELTELEQRIVKVALQVESPGMGAVDDIGTEIFDRFKESLRNPQTYYAYDWKEGGGEVIAVDFYLLDFENHLFVRLQNYK